MDEEFSEFFKTFYQKQYSELTEKMNKKGDEYHRFARTLQLCILILSAFTPVLIASSGFEQASNGQLAIGLRIAAILTSSVAAILAGIGRIFRPDEMYLNARTLRNALWREHSIYKAALHDYAKIEKREILFVERVTSILDAYNAKQNKLLQESSSVVAATIRTIPPHISE
jgi:hypothetical protein